MKKILLITSSIASLIIVTMDVFAPYRFCGASWRQCMDINYQIGVNLLPILPFFFFSLITYKMPEKVFQAWAWFALPWSALSMVLIYMAPEYGQSGFGPSISVDKGFVAFCMSALFVVVSIFVIVVRHLSLRFSR